MLRPDTFATGYATVEHAFATLNTSGVGPDLRVSMLQMSSPCDRNLSAIPSYARRKESDAYTEELMTHADTKIISGCNNAYVSLTCSHAYSPNGTPCSGRFAQDRQRRYWASELHRRLRVTSRWCLCGR